MTYYVDGLSDDPESIIETSSTSMILFAYVRGVSYGWLDGNSYIQSIHRAWIGIKNAIDFDGTIHNIIGETGIQNTPEQYSPKSMFYDESAPGIGAVLRAVAAVAKFNH